jgi:hypothetical protein
MTGTDKEPVVSKRLQPVITLMINTEQKPVHIKPTEIQQLNMTDMVQKSEHTRQIQVVLQLHTISTVAKQAHLQQILRAEQPNMTDTEEKSGVINNLQ